MRISDWSSDVCSSDLALADLRNARQHRIILCRQADHMVAAVLLFQIVGKRIGHDVGSKAQLRYPPHLDHIDRKSVVSGKSVSVRVDLGGRRIITKKKTKQEQSQQIVIIQSREA